ncbi:biotin-protein ligase [Sodiomyces alkalinus F11]|uniref:Biotin-protein ligase n=1 Tax=Sodiomyces alkalinus (strain CBS 110278 / VKM F-3762 / F11) TaxID=1314773 RepID=A0A3N2Q721_SODAK|nr:biotin-protein ligase [Sodiomyces alkalinus F11]ROT42564.1 biotin-protein ligase [Sodiomyces alkalinus F11]
MASRKLNVLVYTGPGTTTESVRHAICTLRRLLTPNYAVTPLPEAVLLNEPWPQTCALLVIPGGADLPYCRSLNGPGTGRISDYVRGGGAYLGLCAGGYFGSARCEFEVGSPEKGMEIVGPRELAFFPGTCRGGAFSGFRYHSEHGARAMRLRIEREAFAEEKALPPETLSYYNGGGVFVDARSFKDQGVEVLASYDRPMDVDGGDGEAAIVWCRVGDGAAILMGPHPEFAPEYLFPQPDVPQYDQLIRDLEAEHASRTALLRACLRKLGLDVPDTDAHIPSLSSLHLSSLHHREVEDLLHEWGGIITLEDGNEYVRAETDTFRIDREGRWSLKDLKEKNLPSTKDDNDDYDDDKGRLSADGSAIDYSHVVKDIVPHDRAWPDEAATPDFDHGFFYQCLRAYQLMEDGVGDWGRLLLYGKVVTSTNTLVDKNPKLLATLPTGFTITATHQVAARGRGANVWVCPVGSLLFSAVIRHPAHLAASRPLVFLQYLAAIAVVEAIQTYDQGYEEMPIRIKWPNDVYARDPSSSPSKPSYVKIAGILSTCTYTAGSYTCVIGIGINAANPRPTTSLNDLRPPHLAAFRLEKLLARLLTRLECLHGEFLRDGFAGSIEERYYRHWLHGGQLVTLQDEEGGEEGGPARARVIGITRDWGLLRAVEVDADGRATGRAWALQSDENSFDYWKGLIRRRG